MKKFLFTILTLLAHLLLLIPITNLYLSGGNIIFVAPNELLNSSTYLAFFGMVYGGLYVRTVAFVTGMISFLHLVLFSRKHPNAPTLICAVLGLTLVVLNLFWNMADYDETMLPLILVLSTIAMWILWIVNGASSKRSRKRSRRKRRRRHF